MAQVILLKGRDIDVDRRRIGISYSGGGPLVLIELGIGQAFVDLGIVPDVIAGASAGALAGAAHALDPRGGAGIRMAADVVSRVSMPTLRLTWWDILWRALRQRERLVSLGDNGPIKALLSAALERDLGLENVTVGHFGHSGRPRLLIAATDRLLGTTVWFPNDTPIEDALVASSAIPGIFPWVTMRVAGESLVLVDGGVITNQPLQQLAIEGCGTIFACAVGYSGGPVAEPSNALTNALPCAQLMSHQCTKLEEQYVCEKLRDRGDVIHVHPEVDFPIRGYNFSPELVHAVIQDVCEKTKTWLDDNLPQWLRDRPEPEGAARPPTPAG